MDGIQMEPIGKYKADRNGSAKAAAWRNMVDQDLDDVAFLADSDKAREARELREAPVAVCSQRRALCLAALVFSAMFATALLVVYATPNSDCPCAGESPLIPGQPPTGAETNTAAANKDRIASNGQVFPWRGARLPTSVIPRHYSLWLHPNLTTGELRGEVSIDFKLDRDTSFIVLNVRDMNVTERALFKTGGALGPKVAKALDYPAADQTYIEFKEKLRRKYNYTLSLRFITKLERNDRQRGFFLTGSQKHRCAVSRFWLTHARSAFPCLDEPHLRATFKLTIVRDRFHVSLTNMPIMATEEAGFYLGHRLLQDEFAQSPPMPPHMVALAVCRLQRRAAPPLPPPPTDGPTAPTSTEVTTVVSSGTTEEPEEEDLPPPEISLYSDQQAILDESGYEQTTPPTDGPTAATSTEVTTVVRSGTTEEPEEEDLPPPEISFYSDQQAILDESGPLLEWVQKTIQQLAFELNTSYPLPKFDIVVLDSGNPFSEGWGLITLSPATLSDTKTIARLLAQQWFGGLVSPRWWSAQWLMEALTSVLASRAPPMPGTTQPVGDALMGDHVLPALRLDSSNSVRAVASPRLERADIEAASDELSIHKGAAIVSMAIEAAGEAAGRAALARLLKYHRAASADARDLWRALNHDSSSTLESTRAHAWDGWCERPGYPLVSATANDDDVLLKQERFVMFAEPPPTDAPMLDSLLTLDLRNALDELFYEPENVTETSEEDVNATTTVAPTTTTKRVPTTKPPPVVKWVIPLTFMVGPVEEEDEDMENITKVWRNATENMQNGTWYDVVNETRPLKKSRWAENEVHLIWMNETEMTIPQLGKHAWVRYNVGARGLYRVAPMHKQGELGKHAWVRYNVGARGLYRVAPMHKQGESAEAAALRAAALYESGAPAERALLLDDAFVLSRAGRLPASRAIAALERLSSEQHYAPWRVALQHAGWWRDLLRLGAAGPRLQRLLRALHPKVEVYANLTGLPPDKVWLSSALLTAGVEWENPQATKQAEKLFDAWLKKNQSIPEIYQEAALTAGVRSGGVTAWQAVWNALLESLNAPRPLLSHRALWSALCAPTDDWLYHRFAFTTLSPSAQRSREWRAWVTTLCAATCRWRGAAGIWLILRAGGSTLPGTALQAAARCLHTSHDYYRFKELFAENRGLPSALEIIALNAAWVPRADRDLLAYFNAIDKMTPHGAKHGSHGN